MVEQPTVTPLARSPAVRAHVRPASRGVSGHGVPGTPDARGRASPERRASGATLGRSERPAERAARAQLAVWLSERPFDSLRSLRVVLSEVEGRQALLPQGLLDRARREMPANFICCLFNQTPGDLSSIIFSHSLKFILDECNASCHTIRQT